MKPKTKFFKMLIGIVVALITVVVSVAHNNRVEKKAIQCYAESDVLYLMETNKCTRTQAAELLELACSHAAVSK